MQQLEIRRPMAREALDPRYYLRSLLAEARRCALISDAEIAAVQAGMQALVLRQAAAWARGRSSSVPAKVAQEIFTSAAFVIGLRLKACAESEDAVEALRQSAPDVLFDAGLELIDRKLTRARLMQRRIEARLFETPNHFYCGTIVDGVNGFLSSTSRSLPRMKSTSRRTTRPVWGGPSWTASNSSSIICAVSKRRMPF